MAILFFLSIFSPIVSIMPAPTNVPVYDSKIGNQDTSGFSSPVGIASDSLGNFYATDTIGDAIFKFDSAGSYITQWGSNGSGNGEFSNPRGVAIDSLDNIYITDSGNNRIQKFDSDGNYLTQ